MPVQTRHLLFNFEDVQIQTWRCTSPLAKTSLQRQCHLDALKPGDKLGFLPALFSSIAKIVGAAIAKDCPENILDAVHRLKISHTS